VEEEKSWIKLLHDGTATLPDLLDATERRYKELAQTAPPAFLLYIDQGEELYVRAEKGERRRFSEILAHGLGDARLRALMSMRSDFLGELQNDEPLFEAHRQINLPPLREPELREVVSRPAELLDARFENQGLAAYIAHETAEESAKDAGALPLLSYLLDEMWTQMVERKDGLLRLPSPVFDLGGVLVRRANAFVSGHPDSEDALRRIFTLKLAAVREDGEPTRRRAARAEFSEEEWRLVTELADHPNRLVVTATSASGVLPLGDRGHDDIIVPPDEIYAEIAHEAIFHHWKKLRDWIAGEREFLAWRSRLEAARRAWEVTPDHSKGDALLMALALAQAQSGLTKRPDDLSAADRKFITLSRNAIQRRKLRAQGLISALTLSLIVWLNQAHVREAWRWFTITRPYMVTQVQPYVLAAEAERGLKSNDSFRECARDCPEMVVVPAGEFVVGSSKVANEGPQHKVVFAKPFAVSKFEVTFEEWDVCAAHDYCPFADDNGWGRGRQPVMGVNWEEAQLFVAWLSRATGKPYRLLSEAEWEYAARAGTQTTYSWGDDIGIGNANCVGCGGKGEVYRPAPVGSLDPNRFGLYDMHGNVWEWVQDCYQKDYQGAPSDGLAWTVEDCRKRVVRGGSFSWPPFNIRSAFRDGYGAHGRSPDLGIRVGRTLTP
jgi:formylglycine-generating enzyme required for sulfatase activity